MIRYILLLLLLAPFAAHAQPDARVDTQMDLFVTFYNQKDNDKICTLFPKKKRGEYDCVWNWFRSKSDVWAKYGKIKSFAYAGVDTSDPEQVRVFKVVYKKAGTKALSFTLHDDGTFGTFRFDTSSDEIEKMIKKVR